MTELVVVFTTFNPAPTFLHAVQNLVREYPVIVVDDGSSQGHDVLDSAEAMGATIVRQEANFGIAAALNVGLRSAFASLAKFAVTFDQDSAPEPTTLNVLRETYSGIENAETTVAAVVPAQFAKVRQTRGSSDRSDARRVIQSGMLISAVAYSTLGPFDEELFIDLVDTDFELRALSRGLRIVAAPTRIDHELGRTLRLQPFVRLPFTITTMASAPFRYYYRVRNRITLTRRYFRAMPWRMTQDLAVEAVYFAVVALSARPRRRMARVMWAGARDALRRRGGPMPASVASHSTGISWSSAV